MKGISAYLPLQEIGTTVHDCKSLIAIRRNLKTHCFQPAFPTPPIVSPLQIQPSSQQKFGFHLWNDLLYRVGH